MKIAADTDICMYLEIQGHVHQIMFTNASSCIFLHYMVSCGFPPIPTKLVNRIQSGLFVKIPELLPDMLTLADYNVSEDRSDNRKPKHSGELSIMKWVQSFAVYMAVLSHTAPQHIPDLLG